MHSFVYGLLGGALIGLSAAILLLFSGDILGASGIVSSIGLAPLSSVKDPQQHWKWVLVAAFFLTSNLFFASEYQDKQDGLAKLSWTAYLIGGFLVGFGTKLGNGCTSGHGICGLARFSKRSLAAVMTFMTMGVLTAFFTQQATSPFKDNGSAFSFLRDSNPEEPIAVWSKAGAVIAFLLAVVALAAAAFHGEANVNSRRKLAPAAVSGVLFAAGLYLSQMVYPVRVLGFLNVGLIPQGDWDATLMFVMGGGMVVSLISYQFVTGYNLFSTNKINPLQKPLALTEGSNFCVPSNTIIDWELVVGSMSFGIGWGISGLCPGPAMVLASFGVSWVVVCYWPAFFVGAYLATLVKDKKVPFCQRRPHTQQVQEPKTKSELEKMEEAIEVTEEQPCGCADVAQGTAMFDISDSDSVDA